MTERATSRIVIAQPRDVVMSVIADFAAYPEWATGVRCADVLSVGAGGRADRVRVRLDAGIVKDSYVLGYEWDGDEAVRWTMVESGSMMSEMSGSYLLAEHGPETEVTFELAVGLRIPLPGILRRKAEKVLIDTALNGLRKRAESAGRTM